MNLIDEITARKDRFACHTDFVRYIVRRLALEFTDDNTLISFERKFFPNNNGIVRTWAMRGYISPERAVELQQLTRLEGLVELLFPGGVVLVFPASKLNK